MVQVTKNKEAEVLHPPRTPNVLPPDRIATRQQTQSG